MSKTIDKAVAYKFKAISELFLLSMLGLFVHLSACGYLFRLPQCLMLMWCKLCTAAAAAAVLTLNSRASFKPPTDVAIHAKRRCLRLQLNQSRVLCLSNCCFMNMKTGVGFFCFGKRHETWWKEQVWLKCIAHMNLVCIWVTWSWFDYQDEPTVHAMCNVYLDALSWDFRTPRVLLPFVF